MTRKVGAQIFSAVSAIPCSRDVQGIVPYVGNLSELLLFEPGLSRRLRHT